MFEVYPKDQKWVGMELTDGSFMSGQLYSYSLDPEETDDRELVLRSPRYRAPGMKKLVSLGSALTAVSAGDIRFLSVTYTPEGDAPPNESLMDRIRLSWNVLLGRVRAAAMEPIDHDSESEQSQQATGSAPAGSIGQTTWTASQ